MNGEINSDGSLSIERAGKMLEQICPWHGEEMLCGDWCPHFGEPDTKTDSGNTWLLLCHHKGLCFEKFTDHRKPAEGLSAEVLAACAKARPGDSVDVPDDEEGK